ncbi:ABC transporter substrate-binding protein [Methylobacter sp. Wu8]|uniref:ABC transporter substrate-binding protein n=1 Tax=Methylobacter sp. Wu8 TaxID=3118457 RepID=UPI002F3478DE
MDRLIRVLFIFALMTFVFIQQGRSLDKYALKRQQHTENSLAPLTVGVSWPFNKAQDGFAQGLELAKEEIESNGGPRIKLIIRDDHNDWETSRKIALEFVSNPDMTAVIGYRDDSIAIRVSGIYEQAELLHMIVGATTASLTEHDFVYIVRTINPIEDDVVPLVRAAPKSNNGELKYAMVWEAQERSSELAYQYQIAQNKNNGELIYQKQYDPETMDIRHIVNELRGAAPDVIYFSGSPETTGEFVRTTRNLGIDIPITLISKGMSELEKIAGKNAMRNIIYLDFYDKDAKNKENVYFVEKFLARFGKYPDTWAAQGYDALNILAGASRLSHSNFALDLASAIKFSHPWHGANGIYRFDRKGELRSKPVFVRVLNSNGEQEGDLR